MHTPYDLLTEVPISTVVEIQRHIIERGERRAIFRPFHMMSDKRAIATWKSDFDRIIHIFNVRSVASVRPSLSFPFQTEIEIGTHAAVSDVHRGATGTRFVVSNTRHDISNAEAIPLIVRRDVSNTHPVVSGVPRDIPSPEIVFPDVSRYVSNTYPIVSEVQSDVADTRTIAPDTHCNKLKGCEGTGGRNQTLNAAHTLTVAASPVATAQPYARSVVRLQLNPLFNIYIQCTRRVTPSATKKHSGNRFRYFPRLSSCSNHVFHHSP